MAIGVSSGVDKCDKATDRQSLQSQESRRLTLRDVPQSYSSPRESQATLGLWHDESYATLSLSEVLISF
ncbi:predicted protein [Botrytis cinerea T4]|uniref:Uncharacterized protein n=1 Tax=Botryotinia fuckeliana (strain T4) TaxID=999810 RepID=G2YQD2_BOTF4|nr:predicted protein [Botrytis cinerea T4]